jgi:hypothetical protein
MAGDGLRSRFRRRAPSALLVVAFLAAIALLVRGRLERHEAADVPSSKVAGEEAPAGRPVARSSKAVRPVHLVLAPRDAGYVEGARPRIDIEELQPKPPWPGPWPQNIDEIEKTPAVERRLNELRAFNGEEWERYLNYRLQTLANLHDCIGDQIESSGGVAVIFKFRVDPKTKVAEGTEAYAEESALDEGDDKILLDCLVKAHVGRTFRKSADYDKDVFYWATLINVPIHNDSWYRWLSGL